MTRRHNPWPAIAVAAALSMGTFTTSWAHHSFAMFDKTKVVKIEGTVHKVEWANPHVYIFVDVKEPNGEAKEYALECASVNTLTRSGWKMNSVKVGDHVTVGLYPLRDGKPGGLLDSVTLANGTTIKG